ncbi:MAG: MaoC family dehydratase [Solirubrobacteraceae bacterium]
MNSVTANDLVTDMAGLREVAGHRLGPTEWTECSQEQVTRFADLTGDHNFLHVDPERAAQTPFGGTIAHGFLSLSLLAPITQRLQVTDAATSVNYGLDKVRFPAPLPVGGRWRGTAEITEVTEITGGLQAKMLATIEVEGSERPAVVAHTVIRYYA